MDLQVPSVKRVTRVVTATTDFLAGLARRESPALLAKTDRVVSLAPLAHQG